MAKKSMANNLEERTITLNNKRLGREIDYIFFRYYVILPWYEFDISRGSQGIIEQAWAMIEYMEKSFSIRKDAKTKKKGPLMRLTFRTVVAAQTSAAIKAARIADSMLKSLNNYDKRQLNDEIKVLNTQAEQGLNAHEKFQVRILNSLIEGGLKNIDFSQEAVRRKVINPYINSEELPELVKKGITKLDEKTLTNIDLYGDIYGISHYKAGNIVSKFLKHQREQKKAAAREAAQER